MSSGEADMESCSRMSWKESSVALSKKRDFKVQPKWKSLTIDGASVIFSAALSKIHKSQTYYGLDILIGQLRYSN